MTDKMEQIVSLCKRRGFIFLSAEIYGGLRGFWDYGSLGARLKKNIRDAWWKDMVMASPVHPVTRQPLTIVPFEGSIITNPKVWEASGHVETFYDTFLKCGYCNVENREDAWKEMKCPACARPLTGHGAQPTSRKIALMFETESGSVAGDKTKVFLRPETAQSIFVNFDNILQTNRLKIPFGIAQIGKAFRNEVTPRHFTFRSREFEQMEIEWFFKSAEEAAGWLEFWVETRKAWFESIGLSEDRLRLHVQDASELAHYAKAGAGTIEIQYKFPWGWEEIEGVAHRTDYDLKRHSEKSGWNLQYFDQEEEQKFFPHVVEPSAGLDRIALAVLCEAYTQDETRPCKEFMKIEPRLAPIKAAFFPLVNRDGMPECASNLYIHYRRKYDCVYEAKGHIGKRYARMDEIGTPFCITIDGETLKSDTVTVRYRDTTSQQRIDLESLDSFLVYNLG